MKIIHINTYDGNGGAGNACLRLNKALNQEKGIQSEVLVLFAFQKESHVINYANNLFRKIRAVFHIFTERYLAKKYVKQKHIPFSVQKMGIPIWKLNELKKADIIHLHWVNHGFLNPKQIQNLKKLNKPIVWTFHDSNAFTGGCHVRYQCVNFTHHCGECPVLGSNQINDLSRKITLAKQTAYEQVPFSIIAPSKWMQKAVKMSSLLGTKSSFHIPNTLDEQVFQPFVKMEVKKQLQLPLKKFMILAGSMPSKKDAHKGSLYLIEALQIFAANNPTLIPHIVLVFFGSASEETLPHIPFELKNLGFIKEEKQLAKYYAAADLFVSASIEDNLPNTVMESLACATPVLAFETGGIPDMVVHKINGYIAHYKDVTDLALGFSWMYHYPDPELLQKNARISVLKKFAMKPVAQSHLHLYHDLIQKHQND